MIAQDQPYYILARDAARDMSIVARAALLVTHKGERAVVRFADQYCGPQQTSCKWLPLADDSENVGLAALKFLTEHAPEYVALHAHRIDRNKYLVVLD